MGPKYEIIIFWGDEDGAFVAEVQELPGCMADGQTCQKPCPMWSKSSKSGLRLPRNLAEAYRHQEDAWHV